MAERDLRALVVGAAELYGWHVYGIGRSDAGLVIADTGIGFPDLVLVRGRTATCPGHILWRELKTARGRTTPDQDRWAAVLRAAGADHAVWRPQDWDLIRSTLGHRACNGSLAGKRKAGPPEGPGP